MVSIPGSVEGLTADWFSAVLNADVTEATVTDAHSGTTGRAAVSLVGSGVPDSVFVKLQPFDPGQAEFLKIIGLGVSEAKLYSAVGDKLPVRVPRCFHADWDDETSDFVMVLEDLAAAGARFATAEDPDVLAVAESLMDELAALHAMFWEQELPWLGQHALSPGTGPEAEERMAGGAALIDMAKGQFAAELPAEFAEVCDLYIGRHKEIAALWAQETPTLIHGDDHIGNLFVENGRTGFYDWAVASRFAGMRDVAYFLCNSMPTDLRRAEQDSLIARYRAGLAKGGVDLDAETAQRQFRLYSLYSWISATTTSAMGDALQPIEIGKAAMKRTTQALIDLDVLGLYAESL